MTLFELDPVTDSRWSECVARSPHATVFHTPQWLEATRRTYGYRPVVFTDAPTGDALRNGVLFCRVASWLTGRRLVALPFSDHCDPQVQSPQACRSLLEALEARLMKERLGYIEVRMKSDVPLPVGFEHTETYCLHTIDLRPDAATVFERFDGNHVQRSIRKAERLGVCCEVGRSRELLREFYAMHKLTRAKHAAPIQPFAWFENLVDCMGDRLGIYMARVQRTPAAAILTLRHNASLVYKYGCSDQQYNRYGATSLLFWRAAQDGIAAGASEFDLGRSDLDNRGLITFKDRLGGRRTELKYYRYTGGQRSTSPLWTSASAKWVYNLVPPRLSAWAGSRLYGHFG